MMLRVSEPVALTIGFFTCPSFDRGARMSVTPRSVSVTGRGAVGYVSVETARARVVFRDYAG
ncbi:hypothetical protein C8J43_10414 [Sphingomonas sp. PP-CE-1G-424]|nr:hypothetical protein C8J43_10414 [Sphingomonas sp. PP-CE-1G-424]